ncbi:outer membrane beta-barrel protein [bacterium]
MKFRVIVALFMFVLVSVVSAGDLGISLVGGYAMSAFEDQDDAAGSIPLGLTVGKPMGDNLEVGLDAKYFVGGFAWEGDFFGTTLTTTFDYTIIDLYAKYSLGTSSRKPYVKGALGYFLGNGKIEADGDEADFDVDPGIGFILGGGGDIAPQIYLEFNYNIVTRKIEGESLGMNSWLIVLGYRIN